MEESVADLVARARAYAKDAGLSEQTVSAKLFGSGHALDQISAGKRSLTFRVFNRASAELRVMERKLDEAKKDRRDDKANKVEVA